MLQACISRALSTHGRLNLVSEVPATAMLDAEWLRTRLELARRLYGQAPDRVLGTVWWYSTSAVLLGAPARSLFTRAPVDPSLEAMTLRILPDGRLLDASSSRAFAGDLDAFGRTLGAALEPAVESIAAACGASARSLWAIATDSLAGGLLAAGQAAGDIPRAAELAGRLADAIGPQLPLPRFAVVGPHTVVRRASCCLIDRIPGGSTCASCPHQHPDDRSRRIRELLG